MSNGHNKLLVGGGGIVVFCCVIVVVLLLLVASFSIFTFSECSYCDYIIKSPGIPLGVRMVKIYFDACFYGMPAINSHVIYNLPYHLFYYFK